MRTVANFLKDRRIQVRAGRTMSVQHEVPEGIAQGSVQSTLYVDEFCIYSSGAHLGALECRLQLALNLLVQWSNVTGLSFNHEKTYNMYICCRYRCPRLAHTFTINNLSVKTIDTHRFLGVTIDVKLERTHM